MVSLDGRLMAQVIGLRVIGQLALFCIRQINRVNSHNDNDSISTPTVVVAAAAAAVLIIVIITFR